MPLNRTALSGLAESAQKEVRVMGNYLLIDTQTAGIGRAAIGAGK
jgi:hypothetical protein